MTIFKQPPCTLPLIIFLFTLTIHAQESSTESRIQHEYLDALHLIGKHHYDEVVHSLQHIISEDTSFYRAYIKLVEVFKYQKALDEAEEYFKALKGKSPANPRVLHALGLIYKEKQNYQKAYEILQKAIQLDPEYYPAYPDFVDVHRQIEGAERNFRRIIQTNPNLAAAHYGLAYLYSRQLAYKKKLEAAKKAVQLQPDFLPARFLMADAYYWIGEYERALEVCIPVCNYPLKKRMWKRVSTF